MKAISGAKDSYTLNNEQAGKGFLGYLFCWTRIHDCCSFLLQFTEHVLLLVTTYQISSFCISILSGGALDFKMSINVIIDFFGLSSVDICDICQTTLIRFNYTTPCFCPQRLSLWHCCCHIIPRFRLSAWNQTGVL